jgi:hypothetical protein
MINSEEDSVIIANDSYCVAFQGKRIAERYYRDQSGWVRSAIAAESSE